MIEDYAVEVNEKPKKFKKFSDKAALCQFFYGKTDEKETKITETNDSIQFRFINENNSVMNNPLEYFPNPLSLLSILGSLQAKFSLILMSDDANDLLDLVVFVQRTPLDDLIK